MTETLIVTVNNSEAAVPDDFGSTPREFLTELGWSENREYDVYREADTAKLGPEDRCSEPMVVSDGDEFVVVPRYIDGGG